VEVVVDVVELDALKDRVAGRYDQSPGSDLDGMLEDLRAALGSSGLFSELRLRKTGSPRHLVEARCAPSSANVTPATIRAELERVWQEQLRYDDFAAHAVEHTASALIFDFLTVARSAGMYMTGLIIVELAG
jgi:hypothetical protein